MADALAAAVNEAVMGPCPAWCADHHDGTDGIPEVGWSSGHHAIAWEIVYRSLESQETTREDLTGVEVLLTKYPSEPALVTLDGPGRLPLTPAEADQLGHALIEAAKAAATGETR